MFVDLAGLDSEMYDRRSTERPPHDWQANPLPLYAILCVMFTPAFTKVTVSDCFLSTTHYPLFATSFLHVGRGA